MAVIEMAVPSQDVATGLIATGSANHVALTGSYVVAAAEDNKIAVAGVSDPDDPGPPGFVTNVMTPSFVTGAHEYVYCDQQGGGFSIYRITSSGTLGIVAEVPVENSSAGGIAVTGDWLHKGLWIGGQGIIDASEPADPELVSRQVLAGATHAVAFRGDTVFFAAGHAGIAVIDVSDPYNPGIPIYADTPLYARDLVLVGDCALVADAGDMYGELAVVDISDLTHPHHVHSVPLADECHGITLGGEFAFLPVANEGLAVVRVTDPMSPGAAEYLDIAGANSVAVAGSRAYIGTTGGIVIANLAEGLE
jgi:hypothetical protein